MPVKKSSLYVQKCEGQNYCKQFNKMIEQLNNLQIQNVHNLNETVK